jgi:hypothetical protein
LRKEPLAIRKRAINSPHGFAPNCHVVNGTPPPAVSTDVPSFSSIASRLDATPERIAGRIIVPHPAMPGISLTAAEIRDIVAYITSLRGSK